MADNIFVSEVWDQLRIEAEKAAKKEELLRPLLDEAILNHSSFKDALIFRLATKLRGHIIDSAKWIEIFQRAYDIEHDTIGDLEVAACIDLVAIKERDPACDSLLTAFLYFKGYKSLQIYRVSHILWNSDRTELASLMQSRSSEVFGVDIHPAAKIGKGLMMDHATGIVIGETAIVGDNCSFLHGVTLGGTGKNHGDRHPKLGDNVVIGCNASILGNITIGDNCKIGAGSVVLKPIPAGATAVGSPARILPMKETPINLAVSPSNALPTLPSQLMIHSPSLDVLYLETAKTVQKISADLSSTTAHTTNTVTNINTNSVDESSPVTRKSKSPSFDVESNCYCCGNKVPCSSWECLMLDSSSMANIILFLIIPLFLLYTIITNSCL